MTPTLYLPPYPTKDMNASKNWFLHLHHRWPACRVQGIALRFFRYTSDNAYIHTTQPFSYSISSLTPIFTWSRDLTDAKTRKMVSSKKDVGELYVYILPTQLLLILKSTPVTPRGLTGAGPSFCPLTPERQPSHTFRARFVFLLTPLFHRTSNSHARWLSSFLTQDHSRS